MDNQTFEGKLSIIIPAYNEGEIIKHSISETALEMERWECPYEIIVVDDGSTDCTKSEIETAIIESPQTHSVCCEVNCGKGVALRTGFEHCSGDLVAFLDADLELHPRQLKALYQIMQQTGSDVVIGSKRHPDSRLDYPWHRQVISTVYFELVNILFGLPIHDTQTGIKLFRHQVLVDSFPRIRTSGYAFDLELLVAANRFGYRIVEAPVELDFQRQQLGRIGLRTILAMTWDTLRIFYRSSFWKWLRPASTTKIWLVACVVGLVAASFGIASALTFLSLPSWTSTAAYYLTLKFIPRDMRNLLFIVGGVITSTFALIKLNKILLRAFAHSDEGDIAGINRTISPNSKQLTNNKPERLIDKGETDKPQMHTDVHR